MPKIMKIQTKYLSEMEIVEDKIIHFPTGLPGFIDETEFIVLDLPENPVFQILQSIKSVNTAFIVTNPYHMYQNYSVDLDDQLLELLEINNDQEVVVLTIVTLKKPFDTSTLNLKAPIIINAASKRGKQYILRSDNYATKASIAPVHTSAVKGD